MGRSAVKPCGLAAKAAPLRVTAAGLMANASLERAADTAARLSEKASRA
jgi:hypothetical protein